MQSRPGWALGFQDEVWFSRLAQPALHAWTAGEPLRLGLHPVDRADPEPKALACYGLWLPAREQTLLRFVNGRPISPLTCAFLAWVAEQLAAEDVRVLALIWDNAGGPRAARRSGWGLLAYQPRGAGLGQEAQSRG